MSQSSIPPEDRVTAVPAVVVPKQPPLRRKTIPTFAAAKETLREARAMMPSPVAISKMQEARQALEAHNKERKLTQAALEKNRRLEEERLGVPLRGVDTLKDPGKGPPPGLFSKVFQQPDPVPAEGEEKAN